MLKGFKAMAAWLSQHAQMDVHPDTLRKAVGDRRHPLPITWDGGFAVIEPDALRRWRDIRRGMRRTFRKCA
jgi:hypothetical protein